MNYIYNDIQNLRTTIERVSYTYVTHPIVGMCYFAIVDCDDKCVGKWDHKKRYCGLVTAHNDSKQIKAIMHNGTKTKLYEPDFD
jgi:hypothetical protein